MPEASTTTEWRWRRNLPPHSGSAGSTVSPSACRTASATRLTPPPSAARIDRGIRGLISSSFGAPRVSWLKATLTTASRPSWATTRRVMLGDLLRALQHRVRRPAADHCQVAPRDDDLGLAVAAEDVDVPLVAWQVLLDQILREGLGLTQQSQHLVRGHEQAAGVLLEQRAQSGRPCRRGSAGRSRPGSRGVGCRRGDRDSRSPAPYAPAPPPTSRAGSRERPPGASARGARRAATCRCRSGPLPAPRREPPARAAARSPRAAAKISWSKVGSG